MQIKYTTGPERVTMGEAGTFFKNEPRQVPDALARRILEKPALKWVAVKAKSNSGVKNRSPQKED